MAGSLLACGVSCEDAGALGYQLADFGEDQGVAHAEGAATRAVGPAPSTWQRLGPVVLFCEKRTAMGSFQPPFGELTS